MPYQSKKTGKFHKLKKLIVIKTESEEEMLKVKEDIHNQLVGNTNYINCSITLNGSDDRLDLTSNEVHVYIFDDCIDPLPTIKVPIKYYI